MDAVLADAARTGHTPTVTEVERRLGTDTQRSTGTTDP